MDYYKTAIINEFNKKKNELKEQAQNEINAMVTSKDYKKLKPDDIIQKLKVIRERLIVNLKNHFERVIPTFHAPQSISLTTEFDEMVLINVVPETGGVKINGVVTGRSKGHVNWSLT